MMINDLQLFTNKTGTRTFALDFQYNINSKNTICLCVEVVLRHVYKDLLKV